MLLFICCNQSALAIAVAAKMRYEELKKQTQAELKATLDDLLEGDDKVFPPKCILIRSLEI